MTEDYDADEIARQLGQLSPLVSYATALPEKVEGTQIFLFAVRRTLTTDEMVSICREMATVIRLQIPDRSNRWAASIHAEQYGASVMGIYSIGWTGHPDKWRLRKGQERKATYHTDWLALRERLRGALTTLGAEGGRAKDDGDFRVAEGEIGRYKQTVFVKRPEFLTMDLITAIQGVLRDGSDDWIVELAPSFGPPFETLWEGVEVRVDSIKEKWDRREAEQLLGNRLKI